MKAYESPDWIEQCDYTKIKINVFGCDTIVYLLEDGSYGFPDYWYRGRFLSIKEWVQYNIIFSNHLYCGFTSSVENLLIKAIEDAITKNLNEENYVSDTYLDTAK